MKKYFIISLTAIAWIFSVSMTQAQDGEQLFKAKCNTCHMVDKNSTGPILKGVKQKWLDAGEGELIYEWVKNSQTLIASGKSQVANEAKNFSAADMTPQDVSKEEVDAILAYVDNYSTPPPSDKVIVDPLSPDKEIITNYSENLTFFYWLITSIIVLLIAIIVMSSSISSLIKSDYFIKKLSENKTESSTKLPNVLLIIGFASMLLFSNSSSALTFMYPGEAESDMPWLLVEDIDNYFMIAINLVLLGVLLYLKRMFKGLLEMVRPPKIVEVSNRKRIRNLNKILTDTVAIEDEHKILMHHEYDGIRELDNNLPPWWVWGFYATIVFAVIYMFNYHILKTAPLQTEEYNIEVAQGKKDVDAYLSKMAMNVDENNATILTKPTDLSSGKALYDANCIACHNPNGEGNIGPNLSDEYWIYGPDVKDLFKTIKTGTPNGMPEHASKLNPIQLQQVSSFVLSLPFTAGKKPEGKLFKKEGI